MSEKYSQLIEIEGMCEAIFHEIKKYLFPNTLFEYLALAHSDFLKRKLAEIKNQSTYRNAEEPHN